jgi:hypothetical protein
MEPKKTILELQKKFLPTEELTKILKANRIFEILDRARWNEKREFRLTKTEEVYLGVTSKELNDVEYKASLELTYLRAKMLKKGWKVKKTDFKFWNNKEIPYQ